MFSLSSLFQCMHFYYWPLLKPFQKRIISYNRTLLSGTRHGCFRNCCFSSSSSSFSYLSNYCEKYRERFEIFMQFTSVSYNLHRWKKRCKFKTQESIEIERSKNYLTTRLAGMINPINWNYRYVINRDAIKTSYNIIIIA